MKHETAVSICLLVLLFLVITGLFVKQSHYDPKPFQVSILDQPASVPAKDDLVTEEALSEQTVPSGILDIPLPEITPMGKMETFDAQTLSDKIDGKADLYLEAGFGKLYCRRYTLKNNPGIWFEYFLYDMGNPRNAFIVYSNQRRPGSRSSSITPFSYESGNAIYFIQGKYYSEIISGKSNPVIRQAINSTARYMVNRPLDAAKTVLPEIAYYPVKNQIPGSYKLYAHNAFGYEKFTQVMTAVYKLDGKEITAFVTLQPDRDRAKSLAKGYHDFMMEFGGDNWDVTAQGIPELSGADLLGDYDLVFSVGNVVAGIHGAKDKDAALKMASIMYEYLKGRVK
jgi:hypothetical protein